MVAREHERLTPMRVTAPSITSLRLAIGAVEAELAVCKRLDQCDRLRIARRELRQMLAKVTKRPVVRAKRWRMAG